ncbi:hypothetical protein CAEBREN_14808, partial [Caenorhabditis brenneri]
SSFSPYASLSYVLSVQTSSPLSVFGSGSPQCSRIQLMDKSGSGDFEIPNDLWEDIVNCGEANGVVGKFYIYLVSMEQGAIGRIEVSIIQRSFHRAEAKKSQRTMDPSWFYVSGQISYSRKIKLQSLSDTVRIEMDSENQENALNVYISFCSTKDGILYTTSYSPHFEIVLKSPRMEMYYDAYSCDSSNPFYGNSTQPTFPLIIRLESLHTINGTMTVFINGEEPSFEKYTAEYETGRFTMEKGETKVVELKYKPTMKKIQAYMDVISGSMLVYLSPCKNQEADVFYSNFSEGAHLVDIDLERMMENTTCTLAEIDPTTVYISLKSNTATTFSLWIPGQIATWHLIVTIGLVLLLLTVCMILIVHFGRKKTGKLVINHTSK